MPVSDKKEKNKTPPPPSGLQIVGTPIGNLEDITLRALRILEQADLIAAEDTRRTRKLLSRYDIHTPLVSYHEHNKQTKTPRIIARLKAGEVVALVSDAGMPGISDPGYDLIAAAIEEEIPVDVVPGPSAILSALALSGISAKEFFFAGFLPKKKGPRERRLQSILSETTVAILFESPNRLFFTLDAIAEIAPRRRVAVARELTKRFEQVIRTTALEASKHFSENEPRGEFVIVIEAAAERQETVNADEHDVAALVEAEMVEGGLSKKEAMRAAARKLNIPRRDVYKALLEEEAAE